MDQVLHPVDHHRPVVAGDVQYSLDAQHGFAARRDQHIKPGCDALPVQRLIEGQAERGDAVIVPVGVVVRMNRVMPVLRVRVSLRIEPTAHVGYLAVGIEQSGVQYRGSIHFAIQRGQKRRAGVQPMQTLTQRRRVNEIGLAQYDAIRDGYLTHRLWLRIQIRRAVHCIDHGERCHPADSCAPPPGRS
jgi:hypothetical protein